MSEGGSFRMMIMEAGPVPPSEGPHRRRYLDLNGREALGKSNREYSAALTLLGDKAELIPPVFEPFVLDDDSRRREIQLQNVRLWNDFRTTVPETLLEEVEPHAKAAVREAVRALNFLEDHELAETAHEAIHRTSFLKRGLFGCPIVHRDGQYWTDCPVNMSHLRVGFSAGLVSDFDCSICGRAAEDCDHQMNELYEKERLLIGGKCSICGAEDCEHEDGRAYLVPARGIARNVIAQEVSMVTRPRYPQARIAEQSLDLELTAEGERLARAGFLSCDADLGPCKGFNDMHALWDVAGGSSRSGD